MHRSDEKAQAAIEYMTVIGFALLILLGLTIFAYNYTITARQAAVVSTSSSVVNNIVETANLVHSQGYPAKATLVIQIPESVQSITFSDKTIVMSVSVKGRRTDVIATAKTKLVGSLPTSKGFYRVNVQSFGDYVNVTRI